MRIPRMSPTVRYSAILFLTLLCATALVNSAVSEGSTSRRNNAIVPVQDAAGSGTLINSDLRVVGAVAESDESISIQPSQNEKPLVRLQVGRRMSIESVQMALRDDGIDMAQAKPLALATDDFNYDGFPDLVCSYATQTGGFLLLFSGDENAYVPKTELDVQNIVANRFPMPFDTVSIIKVSETPDFLFTGDFDRDNRNDILVAARGGSSFTLLTNDSNGTFATPRSSSLTGQITAMTVGKKDSSHEYPAVIVGVNRNDGAALLVFEAPNSVLIQQPLVYQLPAVVDSVSLGQLDADNSPDLVMMISGRLFILHGNTNESAPEHIELPFSVMNFTVGDFVSDRNSQIEIAAVAEDGRIVIMARGELDMRPTSETEIRAKRKQLADIREGKRTVPVVAPRSLRRFHEWKIVEEVSSPGPSRSLLQTTHLSSEVADDLLILSATNRQIQALNMSASAEKSKVELVASGEPIAVLPMRLNVMGQPGLVVLQEGQVEPTMIMAAPDATFVVDRTDDTAAATACTATDNDCSLRGAIIAANTNGTGADMITFTANLPVLTIPGSDNVAASGDLDINTSLTILGNGSATTIIDTNYVAGCGDCKVFGVNQSGMFGAIAVSFTGVTIQDGFNDHNATGTFQETGGGMDFFLTGSNVYSMTDSIVTSNEARTESQSYGGGINIDSTGTGAGSVTFTNTTISNNASDSVGGGINLQADSHDVTFNNCIISGNMATSNGAGLGSNGGGINIRHNNGGTVAIHDTDITGNAGKGFGGGICLSFMQSFTLDQNSTVTNNTVSTATDIPVANGGGLYISGVGTRSLSSVTITGNQANTGTDPAGGGIYADTGAVTIAGGSISNNSAVSGVNGRGGGISVLSGVTTITNVTFSGNSAGLRGGAMDMTGPTAGSGALNVSLSRIVGNTAPTGSGISQTTQAGGTSTATAENCWWGCDGFPNSAGCQTGSGTFDADPRIDLRLTATPTSVLVNGASTLVADVTRNTSGANTNGGNAPSVLVGLNLIFDGGPKGSINPPLTVAIPAGGTISKTFTANNNSAACGVAMPSATLDNGAQTASITIQCADLTLAKTNNVSNVAVVGQPWTWTLTVTNGGNASAVFAGGQTILTDMLPDGAGISYGTPTTTANATCSINGSDDLACTASAGGLTVAPAGSFTIQFTATPTAPAVNANPRAGGIARVDSGTLIVESNEGNNDANNTVTVSKANTSIGVTSSQDPSVFGQSVTFTATVAVTAPGAGSPSGTVNFLDVGNPVTGCQNVAIAAGQAQCTTSALAVGNHTISAAYSGDGNFNTSSGNMTGNPQVVNKANTSVGLTSSQNPAPLGANITFTATLAVTAPGAGSPSGTIQFLDGVNPIVGCTAVAVAAGQAQCMTTALTVGNHTITAAYSGDASFNTSNGSLTGNPQVITGPPLITPSVGLTRVQGEPATNSQVAVVSDDVASPGAITVTAETVPAGMTITNIVNTNGTITADVGALCGATTGANVIVLKATDGKALSQTANLSISVSANPPPTLGNYPNTTIVLGCKAFIGPDAPPADNVSVTSGMVTTSGGFTGSVFFDGTTGLATISNSGPVGPHTITVTLTDNCGATVQRMFTLTVVAPPTAPTEFDFDGDRKADISVYRQGATANDPSFWFILRSSDGMFEFVQFGADSDVIVPGDYDGDGDTDPAVYRSATNTWFTSLNPATNYGAFQWGLAGDIPVPGQYDADNKTDIAVFRPSNGNWYIAKSTGGSEIRHWGQAGDKPIPADVDGDGKTDLVQYRESDFNFYIQKSGGGTSVQTWGTTGDKIVLADYDGDGKDDIAVFRPSNSFWYIMQSSGGTRTEQWGLPGNDVPAPADYDNDGKADLTVYRTSEGAWYTFKSCPCLLDASPFGVATDKPVPTAFIP